MVHLEVSASVEWWKQFFGLSWLLLNSLCRASLTAVNVACAGTLEQPDIRYRVSQDTLLMQGRV